MPGYCQSASCSKKRQILPAIPIRAVSPSALARANARDLADAAFREPQLVVLADHHMTDGTAAARDRPRLQFLRLWIKADEHVLGIVTGFAVPDAAVGRDGD